MSCSRCEKLPELHFANSDVYMNLQVDHLKDELEHTLEKEGYQYVLTKDVDFMQGYLFGKPEEVPVTKIRRV